MQCAHRCTFASALPTCRTLALKKSLLAETARQVENVRVCVCVCVCVVSFLFPFVKILIGSSFRWVELMQPFA